MDSRRHRHHSSVRFSLRGILILLLSTIISTAPAEPPAIQAAWESTLTPSADHPFPSVTPFHATYRFGWEGIPAGGAEVRVVPGATPSRFGIQAEGGPNEVIRKLWNYHAGYVGEAGSGGEPPSWFRMDEVIAKGDLLSEASFGEDVAISCHRLLSEAKPWQVTRLPGIRDLFAAMLFVRSQPLRDGDHVRLIVFPDQHPYLVDLKAEARQTISICGKRLRAVRFRVAIQSIVTEGPQAGSLVPHPKFRSGRVWMSDDARRLPIRAEVDVFIGSVYAELVTIEPGL